MSGIAKITFDEVSKAKNIYEHGFENPTWGNIILLAKYIKYLNPKMGEVLLKTELQRMIKKYDPEFNFIIHRKEIKRAVRIALKTKLTTCAPVTITVNEMQKIQSVENTQLERLLFCTLVLAKTLATRDFGTPEKEKRSNDIYLGFKWIGQVIRLSKLKITKHEANQLYHKANLLGLIDVKIKQNFSSHTTYAYFVIKFNDDTSEPFITVTDFENMINLYPGVIENLHCEGCGKVIKAPKKNGMLLCPDCYKLKRKEDVRENVAKLRAEKKRKELEIFGVRQ